MKNNIGPDSSGLAFRIESATVDSPSGSLPTSRIVWDGEPVNLRADDILGSSSNESGGSAIREAEEFLRQSLTKPMPSIELFREAKAIGVADKTLRRAADNLGVLKNKSGMRGGWTWSLPPKMAKEDEDARQNNVTTFERVDHLREPNTDLREVEL